MMPRLPDCLSPGMMEGKSDTSLEVAVKRIAVLLVAAVSLAPIAARAASATKTNGWISDAMCGAKHAGTGAACARKCVEGGEKPVFVDQAMKEVWAIDNPDAVKNYVGSHVTVSAVMDKQSHSVHINSIAEAK